MGSLSGSELQDRLRQAAQELSQYPAGDASTLMEGPWVREVFENYVIISYEGKSYRHDYSVVGVQVALGEDSIEVKQTWTAAQTMTTIADTTEVDAASRGGVTIMSLWDTLKEKLGLTPEQTQVLETLQAEEGDTAAQDTAPDLEAASKELAAERNRAETARKALEAEREKLEVQSRQMKAKRQVAELLDGRYIVPAMAERLESVLVAAAGQSLTAMSDDGKEQQINMADSLVEVLQAGEQISAQYFEQISKPEADAEEISKKVERMHDAATTT